MENKITNISIRKSFNNIRTIDSQITKRRLIFLGKIIILPGLKIPSRLISAYCSIKRPLGRPNYTIIHSMLNDIRKIIPEVDKSGSFHTCAHIANDELIWSILINNIGKDDPQPCNYSPEWDGNIPESPPPSEPPPFEDSSSPPSPQNSPSPPSPQNSPSPPSPQNSPSPPPQAQNSCFNFRIRKFFEILEI